MLSSMVNGSSRDYEIENSSETIGSLETTFSIVKCLQKYDGLRITRIADETNLSKSTVHKHISTLRDQGFVVKRGDEYQLGFRFLDFGGYARRSFQGSNLIKQKARELADRTGETVQFMIEQQGRAVVLFRETGDQGVRTRARVGKRFYMHQSAAGKALLANLPDHYVDAIIQRHGLPPATEKTITDKDTLHNELDEICSRGYSVNDEESTKGLYAIAVPMFSSEGTVLGAMAVAGPTHRLKEEEVSSDLPNLIQNMINELELNITYS